MEGGGGFVQKSTFEFFFDVLRNTAEYTKSVKIDFVPMEDYLRPHNVYK